MHEANTSALVQSIGELRNGGRNLEALVQDTALPLKADILGPLDEAAQVPLGLDVLANAEVACTLLEQGVDDPLGLGLLHRERGSCHLLTLLVLPLQWIFNA